jgi:hypothetical protein
VTDSEPLFDKEYLEEAFRKENEEPWDLADQAFEQWRDVGLHRPIIPKNPGC